MSQTTTNRLKTWVAPLLSVSATILAIATAGYGVLEASAIDIKDHHWPFTREAWIFIILSASTILTTLWKEKNAEKVKQDALERKQFLDAFLTQISKSFAIIQDLHTYSNR